MQSVNIPIPYDLRLHNRLLNWARYSRDNSRSINHCLSIEHRYRSPQHWHPDDARTTTDWRDASIIEAALVSFPISQQKPITLFYCWCYGKRTDSGRIGSDIKSLLCRVLSRKYQIVINYHNFDDHLSRALIALDNRLHQADNHATISQIQSKTEPKPPHGRVAFAF